MNGFSFYFFLLFSHIDTQISIFSYYLFSYNFFSISIVNKNLIQSNIFVCIFVLVHLVSLLFMEVSKKESE